MSGFVQPLGTIDVRDAPYLADGTGVSDATDAINDASDAAKAAGAVLYGMGGTFRIDGTVNLKTHCNFHGARFIGASGVSAPVIRIADDDAFLKRLRNLIMHLPKVSRGRFTNLVTVGGQSTWPNDDDGVRIEGLSRSIVYFDEIEFCRNGIHIRAVDTSDVAGDGDGGVTGTDFCQFHITNVNGCQTNLWLDELQLVAGKDSGWINENSFFGGSLRHEGVTQLSGVPIPGVRQLAMTGWRNADGSGWPGHNVFYHVSVEGNVHEYAIYCEGDLNVFDEFRFERFDPYPPERIYFGRPDAGFPGGGSKNIIRGGVNLQRITDPLSDYGYIEIGPAPHDRNIAWHPDHIGGASDLGGGWIELVDNTP